MEVLIWETWLACVFWAICLSLQFSNQLKTMS